MMRRRSALIRGGAALVAIVVAAAVGLAMRGGRDVASIPTLTVRAENLQRHVSAEGVLEAENATPINVPSEAQGAVKIGWIAEDQSAVKKGDVLVRFDPTDFENELRKGTDERLSTENMMEKGAAEADAQTHGLERDASHAQLELEAARRFTRKDNDIYSRFERVESEIDEGLATERKRYADDVRGIRRNLAGADRDLLEISRRKAQLSVDRAEKSLRALVVTAPHDGIVVLERDWRGELPRVGATVWPGRPIAEIPALGAMKAEVYVLEADATGVAVGQKATVVVESSPLRKYTAAVTRVDKVAKPRTRGVPVQYFGVTLKLDKSDTKVMKPGARVKASVELANMKNALLVPRQAVFEVKGDRVVYVRRGGRFSAAPVTIEGSTAGRVVVTKGLKDGDVIALSDPGKESEKSTEESGT